MFTCNWCWKISSHDLNNFLKDSLLPYGMVTQKVQAPRNAWKSGRTHFGLWYITHANIIIINGKQRLLHGFAYMRNKSRHDMRSYKQDFVTSYLAQITLFRFAKKSDMLICTRYKMYGLYRTHSCSVVALKHERVNLLCNISQRQRSRILVMCFN